MEELIEILINLIIRAFQNKPVKPVLPQQLPPRQIPAAPPKPAVMRKTPPPRRPVRRPIPPGVAIAQPIVTNVRPAPPQVATVARPIQSRTATPTTAAPTQSAAAIRKWLSPATLRNQFLLTEILQPPLALRDNPYKR
jgi:hypothetical protein